MAVDVLFVVLLALYAMFIFLTNFMILYKAYDSPFFCFIVTFIICLFFVIIFSLLLFISDEIHICFLNKLREN